jgi:hypothetical protein
LQSVSCGYVFDLIISKVCHQVLIHANSAIHDKEVELSTYGMLFLGTPHQGVDGDDMAMLLLRIQSIYSKTSDTALEELQLQSKAIQQQLSPYLPISKRYSMKFFFELEQTTLLDGGSELVNDFLHIFYIYSNYSLRLFRKVVLWSLEQLVQNQFLSRRIM